MIRGLFFLTFAIFIDGLMAGISFGLATITFAAGAAAPVAGGLVGGGGGCAIGAGIGAAATSWLFGVGAIGGAAGGCVIGAVAGYSAGTALGTAAGAALVPLGILLGIAIDMSLTLTVGLVFCLTLMAFGFRYPAIIWPAFFSKLVPVLDNAPVFTGLTIACVLKKTSEEKKGALGVAAGIFSAVVAPGGFASGAMGEIAALKAETGAIAQTSSLVGGLYQPEHAEEYPEEVQQHLPLQTKNFEGVKHPPSGNPRPQVENGNSPQSYAATA